MARTRGSDVGTLSWLLTSRMGRVRCLVLDLRIVHDRFGSNSDPSLNGHLHHPKALDGPLNEAATDKILTYHTDYNNCPSNVISFMPAIVSTSGRSNCEFVRLLFLQDHREADHFFCSFRSSACTIQPWSVSLPQRGV